MNTSPLLMQHVIGAFLLITSATLCAHDAMYFHDHASIVKPLPMLPAMQFQVMPITAQHQLYITLKNDILTAQTEEQMNQAIDELVLYSFYYADFTVFQTLLTEVNQNIAYFEPRVSDRFDYTALKKGLGLALITGLAVYGIKAIQQKYYTPAEILKEQALTDLNKLGVEHHSHFERTCSYDIYTTDFSGLIARDSLARVQLKIDEFRSHHMSADTARGGQCVVGGAGFVAGIAGVGYIYRGLTTDCAQEYARFSALRVKLEEAQTALNSTLV